MVGNRTGECSAKNQDIKCNKRNQIQIASTEQQTENGVVLVSLLLTLNIFHALF